MFSESRTIIDIKHLCEPQYEKDERRPQIFSDMVHMDLRLPVAPQGHFNLGPCSSCLEEKSAMVPNPDPKQY